MTDAQLHELRELAENTFERDLPQLWLERPGQWVAYRGAERLGFATQSLVLYQECLKRGLAIEEFAVFCIEPLETEMVIGPLLDM